MGPEEGDVKPECNKQSNPDEGLKECLSFCVKSSARGMPAGTEFSN